MCRKQYHSARSLIKRLYVRFSTAKQPTSSGCSRCDECEGIHRGYNHIDKFDFLEDYQHARQEAFQSGTIQNSFAASGLIKRLYVRFSTAKQPTSSGCSRCDECEGIHRGMILFSAHTLARKAIHPINEFTCTWSISATNS
jgi:7-cyano-7-deazaguanine synthase in queuosine biosynthesis